MLFVHAVSSDSKKLNSESSPDSSNRANFYGWILYHQHQVLQLLVINTNPNFSEFPSDIFHSSLLAYRLILDKTAIEFIKGDNAGSLSDHPIDLDVSELQQRKRKFSHWPSSICNCTDLQHSRQASMPRDINYNEDYSRTHIDSVLSNGWDF